MAATPRDIERLKGVHPILVTKIVNILENLPMFVVEGVRTAERQHFLWLKGRAKGDPGPRVTNCDGYTSKSNHQAHRDGLGHAVDCAWIGLDPYAETHPWDAYGAAVEAAGLVWGGHWKTRIDRPHAELPEGVSK